MGRSHPCQAKFKSSKSAGVEMDASSTYLPKYDPINPRGEDSHFINVDAKTIGIADGFGGWGTTGVEAGQFARKLMRNSETAVRKATQKGATHPKKILRKAYSETKVAGSSTACLITLSGNILRAVNVGDSGFVIVRDGRIEHRSPLQQHSFNKPYLLRTGNPNDNTSLAEEIEVTVELGDVIIAGTDGLFYNMHEAQLEDVIKECKKLGLCPKQIASVIAKLTQRNSFNTRADTPFSRAATAAGYAHSGGKIDDITVVVAVIRPSKAVETQGNLKVPSS